MTLRAQSIRFAYSSDRELLAELDLHLPAGRRVALTGPNGGGKSTLLRILGGALDPGGGRVFGESGVRYVAQEAPTAQLSGGEARLATLREAFASASPALLLDEPSNDLDGDARRWLMDALRKFGGALLVVSHDPEILDLVDEIWELRDGKLLHHPPGFAAYVRRLEAEEVRLRDEIASLRAEARETEQRARRTTEAQRKRIVRGEKAGEKSNLPKIIRGMKKRQAQATLARLEDVQGQRSDEAHARRARAEERLRQISLFEWDHARTRPPEGRRLLRVDNARLPGSARRLTLEMTGPRRWHLKGRNGSGKSTLLRALAGDSEALARTEGAFYAAKPFRLFDQRLSQFTSEAPLWEWFRERTGLEVSRSRTLLGRLGFEQESQSRPVRALSGGERVRLEIALALHASEPPQLLLLDEPTNHLDLESRRILEAFVKDFAGGIVVVSHDLRFLASLTFDEVIEM